MCEGMTMKPDILFSLKSILDLNQSDGKEGLFR